MINLLYSELKIKSTYMKANTLQNNHQQASLNHLKDKRFLYQMEKFNEKAQPLINDSIEKNKESFEDIKDQREIRLKEGSRSFWNEVFNPNSFIPIRFQSLLDQAKSPVAAIKQIKAEKSPPDAKSQHKVIACNHGPNQSKEKIARLGNEVLDFIRSKPKGTKVDILVEQTVNGDDLDLRFAETFYNNVIKNNRQITNKNKDNFQEIFFYVNQRLTKQEIKDVRVKFIDRSDKIYQESYKKHFDNYNNSLSYLIYDLLNDRKNLSDLASQKQIEPFQICENILKEVEHESKITFQIAPRNAKMFLDIENNENPSVNLVGLSHVDLVNLLRNNLDTVIAHRVFDAENEFSEWNNLHFNDQESPAKKKSSNL